jgi:hypothetical protein
MIRVGDFVAASTVGIHGGVLIAFEPPLLKV